ncbi:glycosyltransferase family 9 protein [Candidatus Atelocyanobacterium thalassae]|jgi:ADP-heptose:LPS heptosyltransferase|uniref:ADP-heptose:LPS heptosyltransferase n=1 Tax=Atelocyanobacterium thalassa (isolate ALOHA) TaxID=1453429 RepID=D3EQC6_ATETH|nr:glycosyltransferase family 9 protein [Candidatus Atelocyanobacterium thalassa]ADB95676.1 ADP-heptose:LPS heptosyltransferase [Candidatus Atelocyanobacterium thalassa isolate ALOHA]MCH2543104.1 glycosyltransferase family 9 protein [Candidatus Atelocyanobacterium sp. ALOHA_A2.5_9]|tara:strand:+ start:88552 stop:89487 length:936 start_codon:yes stop_codon:yes gene_type:complete
MRILCLVPGGINEQLLFFPTLESLKNKYPNVLIDVLVEPLAKSAYRICPYVNEILFFDYQDRNVSADYLNLVGVIRDRGYDIAITTGNKLILELLLWSNSIPWRIGYKTQTSWFLSHSITQKEEQYAAETYHDLLLKLNIQPSCPSIKIAVPKDDISWTETQLQSLSVKENGYIAIYGGENNSYPVSSWIEIINSIQKKEPSLSIVLLESNTEQTWTKSILDNCKNLKIINPDNLGKLSAVIAGANLLVCIDSVPLQLGIAVGTYTIALFSDTKANHKIPTNYDRCIAIQSPSNQLADISSSTILEKIWNG